MGIFDWLFGGKKTINKEIEKLEKRKQQKLMLENAQISLDAANAQLAKDKNNKNEIKSNKKRKIMCDDGVERYLFYNRENKTIIEELDEVKVKKIVEKVVSLPYGTPFSLIIPNSKWFNSKGKTMVLNEILNTYKNTSKNNRIKGSLAAKWIILSNLKYKSLIFINGYAINKENLNINGFSPFTGIIDESEYIEGVLKTVIVKKDKAPDWFTGTLYEKGDTIEHKGREFKLSALELSIYDLLMGSYAMTESPASQFNPNYASFMINQKNCIEWFRVENPKLFEALTAIE